PCFPPAPAPTWTRTFPYTTLFRSYWRYLYARSYHGDPVDSAIISAVRAHRTRFPEPDRLMVEARMIRGERERLARQREITERFRSEEHTSELQSREKLVCRLLLEK